MRKNYYTHKAEYIRAKMTGEKPKDNYVIPHRCSSGMRFGYWKGGEMDPNKKKKMWIEIIATARKIVRATGADITFICPELEDEPKN